MGRSPSGAQNPEPRTAQGQEAQVEARALRGGAGGRGQQAKGRGWRVEGGRLKRGSNSPCLCPLTATQCPMGALGPCSDNWSLRSSGLKGHQAKLRENKKFSMKGNIFMVHSEIQPNAQLPQS